MNKEYCAKTELVDDRKKEANAKFIQGLACEKSDFESPINITICKSIPLQLPALIFMRHSMTPQKLKLTNSGQTLILSGKWNAVRPFLQNGPLNGTYAFSQLHFHWGANTCEGSEHSIDGQSYPLEMHVVYFKGTYYSQKEALLEPDGVVVVAYFFRVTPRRNQSIQGLVDGIAQVSKPFTFVNLEPVPLETIFPPTNNDYFLYWGAMSSDKKKNLMLWVISRTPLAISADQLQSFYKVTDANNEPLVRNFRPTVSSKRRVFHINPLICSNTTMHPVYNPE